MGGKLYAVGGYGGSYLKTAEVFDPATGKLSSLLPMGTKRSDQGVAALGGKLYAVGGYDGSSYLKTAEVFELQTGKWTALPPMGTKRADLGVAACC